jgi:hypothetical protein
VENESPRPYLPWWFSSILVIVERRSTIIQQRQLNITIQKLRSERHFCPREWSQPCSVAQ